MADKKISALTSASTPLAGTEVLPIVQSGATVKVAVSDLTAGRAVSASTVTTTGTITSGSYLSVQKSGTTYAYVGSAGDIVSGGANADMALSTPGVNNMVFAIANNEKWRLDTTGNLVVKNSGNGIDFSATPGTGTSELFADYEEGTWTPALTFGGGNTGITYGSQNGYYTKIGRQVFYYLSISLSNKGSSTGDAVITGLPFTASSGAALFPDGVTRVVAALTFIAPIYATVLRSTTTIALLNNVAGSQVALSNTAFANNTEIAITGFYFV